VHFSAKHERYLPVPFRIAKVTRPGVLIVYDPHRLLIWSSRSPFLHDRPASGPLVSPSISPCPRDLCPFLISHGFFFQWLRYFPLPHFPARDRFSPFPTFRWRVLQCIQPNFLRILMSTNSLRRPNISSIRARFGDLSIQFVM